MRRGRSSWLAAPLHAALSVLAPISVLAATVTAAPAAEPPAAPHARLREVAELTADLGYGTEYHHVEAAVPYLAARAAPDDPAWKPGNPRWSEVCALIATSLRDDARRSSAESERTVVQSAENALATLTDPELDLSLAFFRSPRGRHFLELQSVLTDISIESTLTQETGASTPPDDVAAARRTILGLWLPIVFTRALYSASAAEQVVGQASEQLSNRRGAKLDALVPRFTDDTASFSAYLASPAFAAIVAAMLRSGEAAPAPDLNAFLSNEVRTHGAEWRAAYFGM